MVTLNINWVAFMHPRSTFYSILSIHDIPSLNRHAWSYHLHTDSLAWWTYCEDGWLTRRQSCLPQLANGSVGRLSPSQAPAQGERSKQHARARPRQASRRYGVMSLPVRPCAKAKVEQRARALRRRGQRRGRPSPIAGWGGGGVRSGL